jgi:predicted kinase
MNAVIFMGIQATGKTTFYRERLFKTHIRLSLDMLKTRHREDVLLRACLEGKQPFVIDNTNPTTAERARYIEAARQARFQITGYYFHSSIEEALRRNALRNGKDCVPEKAILGTFKKLQLPSMKEGFDTLYYVTLSDQGEFLVQEWNDGL